MREWTKETFHSAYETYSTMVYRLCMLYLKNESDAKDALQDIFLKIWERTQEDRLLEKIQMLPAKDRELSVSKKADQISEI